MAKTKLPLSLDDAQEQIMQFVEERDWSQFHNPKDLAISLVLEANEVLEHFQWKNESEMKKHLAKNRNEVGEELCDTLYWVLLMSHYFDVDIATLFNQKMEKNRRKYPIEKAKGSHKKYNAL